MADQGYAQQQYIPPVEPVPPAVEPLPLDGAVTVAQQYSIATAAARDELTRLHQLLTAADEAVLKIRERFQQG